MDIEIPPGLQWVSYLAGGEWPQGSETRTRRLSEYYQNAAEELETLIPELNRVRGETLSVLFGDTADAADKQFAMLFDGDYAVDKLVDGLAAMGDGASYFGTEIEYNKLSIIVGLILAAAEISWCLANAGPTAGASLSAIPAVEMTTAALIRRLIMEALERILMQMRAMLTRTGIKTLLPHMLKEGFKETGQELAQGLLQEGIVQGIQAQEGHADYRWDRFRQTAIASAVGGGTGGASAVPVAFGLSGSRTKLGNRLAGVTTMFTAGITGNIAGSLSVGGGLDTVSILAGATSTSIGGIKGMGGGRTNGTDPENGPNNAPNDPTSPAEPSGPTPDDLADVDPDAKVDESTDTTGEQDDTRDDTEGRQSSGGARATPTSTNTTSVKGAVAQHDPSASGQGESADQRAAVDDSPTTSSPESSAPQTGEVGDRANQEPDHAAPDDSHHAEPSTQSPDHAAPTREANDQPQQPPEHAAPDNPVTDSPAAQNGHVPESHDPATSDPSTSDPTTVAETGPETTIEPAADTVISGDLSTDTTVDTTDAAQIQHPVTPAAATPPAPANAAAPIPVSNPPIAPTTPTPKPAAASGPVQSRDSTAAEETPEASGDTPVAAASSTIASPSENAGIPAARIHDSAATPEQSTAQQDGESRVAAARADGTDTATDNPNGETRSSPPAEPATDNRPPPNANCANNVADRLTNRYRRFGRIFRIRAEPTSRGVRARALFEAAGSSAEFATYADIEAKLKSDELGPGSAAIITSAWAGGPNQGGHAYLAVNDGDGIYLLDGETGERLGWPPSWGRSAVSLTAVGYLDAHGEAVSSAGNGPTGLAAADAVGYVRGHRDDGDTSNDGGRDPGDRWRDAVPPDRRAEGALGRRVPPLDADHVDQLRNPLGSMEAADARARSNATWWAKLTGDEQRALIDTYPRHIGNAEGIPADARHEANKRSLDQSRRQLQALRDDGHRLSRSQRKLLARLDRIDQALNRSDHLAQQAGVGGPRLLAFDSTAFGGDGRAVVSFGADPYRAQSVSWHIPGQGMTIDQLGYCMGDALNHLRSTMQENPELSAASIAWIGYDTPSGLSSWRAAGHSLARQGGANLYSDIRAFNAARDTWAGDDSHFSENHVFAHSYGSTAASYAGRDGRLANDIRTISLAGSPGTGPVRTASEFGLGDNVYVASSSRDPFTALGGRTPGSRGRIFGIGLGVDPAMDTFGGQRVTAEFSSDMDRRQSRGTHNSYYRFANRGTDPPVRSESLANFGRIAAGHVDRIDTEQHRTADEQPRRFFGTRQRTVEPAAGRPLRLDGEASTRGDRETRRWWNPRWANEVQSTDAAQLEPRTPEQVAQDALEQRGVAAAADLVSPADHDVPVREAVARARRNAQWWASLSRDQQQALINTYSREIGNAEGIPPMARDEANQRMLRRYLAHRDLLVSRRDNGVALSPGQERYVKLMNEIDAAMRTAERNVEKFGMRDQGPYLLAFDPQAFGGVGRAIVSFGADPYTAQSVSWYVPGMSTTIDKLSLITSRAFNQLRSVQQENPDLSVASIAYIGYRAPGSWDAKVLSQRLAREGGEIFCSDISAFNAGRDVFTGDGSHFSGNHVFAHSYGSSTVSHAGSGRRLADQVRTITLIGSPGAGPMRHASQFGIGDNVFVAASSRDPVTGFGGERPGLRSRFSGRTGQGMDPAMHEFGARRITAEFPVAVDHRGAGSRMTHSLYWAYMDPGTTQVRSESLTNFGRIAAGRTDQVDTEDHRTIDRQPRRFFGGSRERTFEPAIGRHLRLSDDPNAHHPVDGRHIWNPRFRNSPETATTLTEARAAAAEPTLLGLPDNALSDVEQERARDKALATAALKAGRLNPSDLVSPADHKVPVADAVARARRNAQWWAGLSRDQQQGLINTYSREIGNAEGIPPMARNEANQRMLRRYLAHRDLLVSRRENGVALNSAEVRYVKLMHEIDNGLLAAERRLAQLGLHDQGPYLLALDPRAFGGAGRAIVSFGANPYTAQSVSWYVPGMTTNIEKMRAMALRGINQLQSTLQENPDLSAASITYIGYRAPGSWDPRVGFQRMARQGGNIFCSDLLSFNAGRDVFTGDGSHFSGNHVFAHSYGSSTVSHAGSGRRLAGHVRTITMIGSPGAGPLRTARDFGIGDNVFVAASSRDRTTGLGGDRPGARGRIFRGMGQGIDPAMDIFRARRITAEFPAVLDHMGAGSRMTHSLYWAYMDPGTTRVRSEALTNFGRIAAGRADQVDTEGHRTLDRRPRRLFPGLRERSVEPALGRPLRLADDPNTYHSVHGRNRWNPNFLRSNNCAQFVVDELNRRYPDRNFALPTEPSARGVPARSLFQAIASSARFTTYDEIPSMLEGLGIGSSAVLVSRWSGRSQGGHAYFAVKVGPEINDIIVVDSHSGETTGWPPKWGEGAVRRTAVGYLRADGSALETLTGDTGLSAADRIGHVQGSPAVDDNLSPAEQALALRVPRVQPDELRNPLGNAEEAAARARNNATWWQRLSPTQRQDVIDAYPEHIGNAEGIPAKVRDEANRNVVKQLRDRADRIQTKIDEFERPTRAERQFLAKFNRLDQALQKATTDAQQAGQDAPLLLAFDPVEFGGDGRAVLSFGHDPYTADSVSWHVPGVQTTLNSLFGFYTHSALNHLQSVQQENPGLKASSIAWIGYDTPSGLNLWRAAGHKLARVGGDTLYSDITAFNAVREAADGSAFTGNHVFGYSYGSTTTGYAGRDGRLAGHVSTISLVGSPGVGPVRHASGFGIGEHNVFVASSSQDVVTMLGGRTPGSSGRILGIGLGINPAMNSFGAVRMTAEFPSTMSHLRTGGTHHAYYLRTGTSERTESLANLGRVAAGHPERVDVEQHRTAGRWRTVEPATARRVDGQLTSRQTSETEQPSRVETRPEPPPPESSPPRADGATVAERAKAALAQRGVRAADLVNPLGKAELAEARAADNATWWAGLEEQQRQDLIATFPRQIGNAEGIWAAHRDQANRAMLDRYRARANEIQARLNRGERINEAELDYLRRINKIDSGLNDAAEAAKKAGVGGPLLLAFDPLAFGRDGRAIVSFTSDPDNPKNPDPYQAKSVSWIVPGIRSTIETLSGFYIQGALNHLLSTMQENPTQSAASMLWIGYDAPNDAHEWRAAGHKLAREGGDILYSDVRAFNAARNTWTGEGSKFTGNHIFGHSYGSTTTSYAGRDGRLKGYVSTVTLIGSPGAGPLSNASEFDIGDGNVFVASSSYDFITALGGRTPDQDGRVLGRGLGIDPVMDAFGAVRVTAEFPAAMNTWESYATHRDYFAHVDAGQTIRTESLANFGRIAAGHAERLDLESHRTDAGRSGRGLRLRTREPAAGRVLRLEGDTGAEYSGNRFSLERWNPRWLPGADCALQVAHALSVMFGRSITIDAEPTSRGVPARSLFEAINSSAQFATYEEIENALLDPDNPATVAVLASSWTGRGQGGHAYLAVNEGGKVYLVDPHSGKRSGWPPYWGEDAVKRTAVGYLRSNGKPVVELHGDTTGQLADADKIGHVQGHRDTSDFARLQAEYRAQNPTTRHVDTRYAQPVGEVVDNTGDLASARQLAEDLSGVYGPYRIELEALRFGSEVRLTGKIFNGDTEIGTIQRIFDRDGNGKLVAYHTGLVIKDTQLQGQGFSRSLSSELERLYVDSGVDRIELTTHAQGGAAWADRYTWNPDPGQLQESLDRVKMAASRLSHTVSDQAKALLGEIVQRLEPNHPRLPEPVELRRLATAAEPKLGRRLLASVGNIRGNDNLHYVRYMPVAEETPQPRTGFLARLKGSLGFGNKSQNCAHRVAAALSTRYPGRDFRVAVAPSRTGVPAWALFQAVGSRAEFTSYDDVRQALLFDEELGDGSSAVLTSRWAGGRQGGHAYLAVNDGGEVYLLDLETGQRSDWPPSWGEGAVDRTAVGYIRPNGTALHGLDNSPLQVALAHADAVGDVQGVPSDPDFLARQAEYRAQDHRTRRVDTRYAEPLGEVVDGLDPARARRFADDLSGVYGHHPVEMFRAEVDEQFNEIIVGGHIMSGDEPIGFVQLTFNHDSDGNRVAHVNVVEIFDKNLRRAGFLTALMAELEPCLTRNGFHRIELRTEQNGGYAFARLDFTWNPDPQKLQRSLDSIKSSADQLRNQVSAEGQAVLDDIVQRLEPGHPNLPKPAELAVLATRDEPDLGRDLLTGTYWNGVKYLRADDQVARYPSPDDVELAGFWDRIGGLDSAALTPEMLVDAVYQSVPTDTVTGFYEGRISGFKTGEVVRAQQHVADTLDNAFFLSADIANLRGLNQACADRAEANAHFAGLSAIFRAVLEESGLVVVPMRIGGDELGAVVVGDVDETLIESMVALTRARVAEYAQRHNLADIAHPKHPGQPQYNGVGLHIGYAEVLPGLEVRDIFDAADLGVDRSKTRSSDVTGGQGRATGTDGAESGRTGTSDRGAGTRTGREAAGGESEVAGSTGREDQGARQPLSGSGYSQPDEVKRAAFAAEAERVCGQGTQALAGLFEPLRRDEVSGFYDGRSAHFKTSEVARARAWMAETGQPGFFVSAMLSNLSGLNQHVQNRAEAANGHYRAITEMFLAALEATGAAIVPIRTGGDRLDAVVVGEIDSAAIDDAMTAVAEMIAIYTQDEGLADIANPSNAGRPGVHLNLGYADIASHGDVEDVIQVAEQQMFNAADSADLADQALAQRDSQFEATDLVHSVGDAEAAAESARANAVWWNGLSDAERQALIDKYPAQIGNAEGIPPLYRHEANTRALQDWLRDRDELQAMKDRGVRLGHVKSSQLERMNRVDDALQRAADAAREAQVEGPYLLRFDPDAFGGAGMAMVSFGADPHLAESVSWHVPGRGTTLDHLGACMGSALNHLRSVRHEDPTVVAASMAWIGYDTLADDAPQAGGHALHRDIRAFNAGRDALAEGGSRFSANHVFGHCQGSTVSGHAGEGGRLRGQIRTVTLIGSPGVPMDHASEFGSGVDVYVAASSLDDFTWDGGRTPGARGTFRDGYGVDPTMEFFGAQRITAEYPLSLVAMGHEFDAHNSYYRFVDKSTGQRNESLANFGRIAAGHPGRLQFEADRSVATRADGTTSIDDPAAVRAVEVEDPGPPAAEANHSDDRDTPAAQQEYRNQARATRTVDSRYAEPLGDIIDNLDEPRLRQLAEDLSGEYGPYRVELFPEFDSEGRAGYLHGVIYSGDTEIGYVDRSFYRDDDGKLVVYNGLLEITNEDYRGKGFSKAFAAELERYYIRSGVDRIELTSSWQGSNAWARQGFTWKPGDTPLQRSLDAVKRSAEQLRPRLSAESQAVLDEMVARLEIGHPRLPEPIDLALLATADEPKLGQRLLDNTSIYFVKYLPAPVDVSSGPFEGDVQESASQNCAHGAADLLSERYPGRDFTVGAEPSRTGVPARALFEAAGSASRYATYAQVEATLKHEEMGDGSSAVVVSRWRGGRAGGHAYLAVNDGGEVYLLDPETGERSGWPPHWGEDGVDRIAVGYLDSDGNPTIPLDDVPFRLNAADAVGDVRGMPSQDPDYVWQQEDYRDQDRSTRWVDTRYADLLGDVVDAVSSDRSRQLAEDLSGMYGPYRVELEVLSHGRQRVVLEGDIFVGDRNAGAMTLTFDRDSTGNLVVHDDIHILDGEAHGRDLYDALNSVLGPHYADSHVDRVVSTTDATSAYGAVNIDGTWDPDPARLQESLDNLKLSADRLRPTVSDEAKRILDDIVARLESDHPRLPEPSDLAALGTRDEPDLGSRLLDGIPDDGAQMNYVKYLWDTGIQHTQNCAHWIAGAVSARYGLEVALDAEVSERGAPARALFEAFGSRAQFADYADIERELLAMDLGEPGEPGPAAIVVSSWTAGRSEGGHAYLAVRDGDHVFLVDPFTGERSGWPPFWGEGAVARTAVGYLDTRGEPTQRLDGRPDELSAADAVGHVQGGVPGDPLAALGLPDYTPGSLSEREAVTVFSHGEHGMRELNEQLIREGVGAEERARQLSDIRNSLRARTYELMSNRAAADWLAAHTPNPTFEELVGRNQERGLVGDEVFEAIIETATHSHFAPGTLSDIETTELYSQFELGLRALNEQMIRDGLSAEQRARELSGLRSSLRAWTRELMENRPAAEWMAAYESNPTFDDLVARYERKGLSGDAVYEAIIDGATHSHYATATLSDEETRTVYTTLELKMREIRDKLLRDGVGAEERARTMYGLRATIRSWTRALMQNRELADDLNANERNPTFEELVEKNRARGKVGDEIYEAIVESSTRSRGSVNESLGIDPENPPDLPPMRGPADPDGDTGEDSYDR